MTKPNKRSKLLLLVIIFFGSKSNFEIRILNVNIYVNSFIFPSYYCHMEHSGFFLVLVDEQIMKKLLHCVIVCHVPHRPCSQMGIDRRLPCRNSEPFLMSRSGNGNG